MRENLLSLFLCKLLPQDSQARSPSLHHQGSLHPENTFILSAVTPRQILNSFSWRVSSVRAAYGPLLIFIKEENLYVEQAKDEDNWAAWIQILLCILLVEYICEQKGQWTDCMAADASVIVLLAGGPASSHIALLLRHVILGELLSLSLSVVSL